MTDTHPNVPALVGADLKADLSRIVVGVDFARLASPEPIVFTQLADLRGTIRLDRPAPEVVPFAETVERMTALFRPVVEAFRTQFEAISTAVREVSAHLMEDPGTAAMIRGCFIRAALNDPNREPEPEGCHHLCGRDHECLGEASTTFVHPRGGGHEIPMCAVCRACAVDACVRMGVVSRAEYLELIGADIQSDPSGEYDGIIASLDGAYCPSPAQTLTVPALDWGMPLEDSDANWPDEDSNVCAHVCGGDPDHVCDVRAATQLTYGLPSGGTRAMPVCRPCFNSEWAAKQRYQLVSEGELVRLDCKECPETLLRVTLPTEVAHDAVGDACAEHDRLRHAEASPAAL